MTTPAMFNERQWDKIERMCKVLEIEPNEWREITSDQLKKKHRTAILKWHPDKRGGSNGDKFIEVNDAYKYLLSVKNMEYSFLKNKIDTTSSSKTAFNLANIYNMFSETPIYTLLLRFLTSIMEDNTYMYLSKLDTTNLKKIYSIMEKYFPNATILDFIKKIMEEKTESYIILNPNIDDLLEHNIYKLRLDGETYIVPLWHHELIYDHCGNEIIIECCPVLDSNIEIDENNNVYVYCEYNVGDVFDNNKVEVRLSPKHSVFFDGRELRLTSNTQELIIRGSSSSEEGGGGGGGGGGGTLAYGRGISVINEKDIYDISERANIILCINLDTSFKNPAKSGCGCSTHDDKCGKKD